jgi:hypothetical protein
MNFIDRVNKCWDEIAETETVKAMWFNVHKNGILNYVEDEIFKEFKFSKRLKQLIRSRLDWYMFDLMFEGSEINFDTLTDLMKDVINSECEQERISKKRLQHIMSTIDCATDNRDNFNDLELYVKAKIIEDVLQLTLEDFDDWFDQVKTKYSI